MGSEEDLPGADLGMDHKQSMLEHEIKTNHPEPAKEPTLLTEEEKGVTAHEKSHMPESQRSGI